MIHMMDTNAVSHLLRERDGRMVARLDQVGLGNIAISVVVLAELEFGMALNQSVRLRVAVDQLVSRIRVIDIGPEVAATYGPLRARLKASGRPIGPNDLWIAAHALSLDAVLVTDNEREFSRIPGLKIQNWLRDAAEVKG